MEINNNNNKINNFKNRSKSLPNNFMKNPEKREKRSSNILSSVSKKTPAFNEKLNCLRHLTSKRLLSQTMYNEENINIQNSTNTNQFNKSQEISMQNIRNKNDLNVNCTNINISIVNPNFSMNNFESRHSAANINNKINFNIINNSLLSFNDNNAKIKIEKNEYKIKSDKEKAKIITNIYKDYIENKSQEESFSINFGDETLKQKFKKYLNKNKIAKYEYKTKGIIAGFSAYMYQNEENINKDKICLNINVDKSNINQFKENDNEVINNSNIINFFSLFCGGKDDTNDELPTMLKNKLKNLILNNKKIINNPEAAIKKGLFNSELEFINYFLEDKAIEHKLFLISHNEKLLKIPSCSIFVLLNIDDIFYIANIGKIVTILSSNYSQKINYLSKEYIIPNSNIDENFEKKINNIEDINDGQNLNNNIIMDKSDVSILNNNISNKIFPQLNLRRAFPGNTIYKLLAKKYNLSLNNSIISNKDFYDKFKRRSSATIINLINVLNKQQIRGNKINTFHINESNNKTQTRMSNSSKFIPYIIKNNNLINQNFNEPIPETKITSSYPDVLSFKYQKNHDFILICSKVIYEFLDYEKISKGVYETMKKCIRKNRSFEIFLGCVVKDIIKSAISLGITTNISCIFICFESIKNLYLKHDINSIENEIVSFYLSTNQNKKFELYENLLNSDLIDIDKAYEYEKQLKKEIDKLNNKKMSTINISGKHKIFYNNFINDTKRETDIQNKVEVKDKKKKKCCLCNIF